MGKHTLAYTQIQSRKRVKFQHVCIIVHLVTENIMVNLRPCRMTTKMLFNIGYEQTIYSIPKKDGNQKPHFITWFRSRARHSVQLFVSPFTIKCRPTVILVQSSVYETNTNTKPRAKTATTLEKTESWPKGVEVTVEQRQKS